MVANAASQVMLNYCFSKQNVRSFTLTYLVFCNGYTKVLAVWLDLLDRLHHRDFISPTLMQVFMLILFSQRA
jgi:hypothetical protein